MRPFNRGILIAIVATVAASCTGDVIDAHRAGLSALVHVDQRTGQDGPGCGSEEAPCQTIGAALGLVAEWGTIEVGPGIYPENLSITTPITIRATEPLVAKIRNTTSWTVSAPTYFEGLYFHGQGAGRAIEATTAVSVLGCQIEDYDVALFIENAAKAGTVKRSRLIGNQTAVGVADSGSTYSHVLDNNIILGRDSSNGYLVQLQNSAVLVRNNLIGKSYMGIIAFGAVTGMVRSNLFLNVAQGLYANGVDAAELTVQTNAFGPEVQVQTQPYLNVQDNITDNCGVSAADGQPFEHPSVPQGGCIDAGADPSDLDGTPNDIGPYGGLLHARCYPSEFACADPDGDGYGNESWWVSMPCRDGAADDLSNPPGTQAVRLSCPHHYLREQLGLQRYDTLAANLRWWEEGVGWPAYRPDNPNDEQWSAPTKFALYDAYDVHVLGVQRNIGHEPPVEYPPDDMNPWRVVLSPEDARIRYLSQVQQSLRAELDGSPIQLPWSVDNYSADMLAALFDGREHFMPNPWCKTSIAVLELEPDEPFPSSCTASGLSLGTYNELMNDWEGSYTRSIVMPSPGPYSRGFMDNEVGIGFTPYETIGLLLRWAREHTRHGQDAPDGEDREEYYWGNPHYRPLNKIIEGTDPGGPTSGPGFAHWAGGCLPATDFLRAVLRIVNIPVRMSGGAYGHAAPHFMNGDFYMVHTDDMYNSYARAHPVTHEHPSYDATELLIGQSEHVAWFRDGTTPHRSRVLDLALEHRPPHMLAHRCEDLADASLAEPNSSASKVGSTFSSHYTIAELDAADVWNELDAELLGPERGGCANYCQGVACICSDTCGSSNDLVCNEECAGGRTDCTDCTTRH